MLVKKRGRLIALIVAALCIALAFICRKHAPAPQFAWFFLLSGIGCMTLCCSVPLKAAHYFGIALLAAALALAGGEVFLSIEGKAATESAENVVRVYTENGTRVRLLQPDPVTGYRAKPSASVRVVQTMNNEPVYDVVYNTDEQGWRVLPQHPDAEYAVVFFGCSFTFGEGLNAEETFAWRSAEALGEKYQVYNFGFSGYGPHQALALLDSGVLGPIAAGHKKTHVFFLHLSLHGPRAAGTTAWDRRGPWYAEENGVAVRKGTFVERVGKFRSALDNFFKRSRVYSLFFTTVHTMDAERVLNIHQAVLRGLAAVSQKHPHTDFTLLLWPDSEDIAPSMREAGVTALPLSPVLPGYLENPDQYQIWGDGHPNAYANELLSAYLVRHIRALDGQ